MHLLVVQTSMFEVTPARLLALQEAAPHLTLQYVRNPSSAVVAESEIICGCPPVETLAAAPRLQWHHVTNAGLEPYSDLNLYANRSVTVTNASGVYGIAISEHVVGLMIALSRYFPRYIGQRTEKRWQRYLDVREIYGSTVCVVGLGDLGSQVVRRLSGFGCRIVGVRRNVLDKPAGVDELYSPRQLLQAVGRADYVISCLPQTAETVAMFDRAAFDAMPPGCVFINVGRGSAVVESALVDALASGRLFGAGIDVTDPEPLPPDSPLWDCETAILTCHGSPASPLTNQRGYELFSDLLSRYMAGRKLYNVVDFHRGY